MKQICLCAALAALLSLAACRPAPAVVGTLTEAPDAASWAASQWISAADAPVVT